MGFRKDLLAVTLLMLVVVLAGCSGDEEASFKPAEGESSAVVDGAVGDDPSAIPSFGTPGGDEWPEGIPADIPVLAGEITNVMADGGNVRLFFNGVSDEAVVEYVQTLGANGFDLEFIVYETPGSGDSAQRQADAGEWDAVRAAKGSYTVKLEFGGGGGTLDIGGLPEGAVGPDLSWPWDDLPAPDMTIFSVMRLTDSPFVELNYETEQDVEAYADVLEGIGFVELRHGYDQNHDLIDIALTDGTIEIELRVYQQGHLGIAVQPASEPPSDQTTRPPGELPSATVTPAIVAAQQLPDWMPAIPGGDILSGFSNPDGSFVATVTIGEGFTVAGYVVVLNEAGFIESDTMPGGYVLSDGSRTITIYGIDTGTPTVSIAIQTSGP